MTDPSTPPNAPYHRRFRDPGTRPSNKRTDLRVEHTRASVAELSEWLDGVRLVEGMEQVCADAALGLPPRRPGDPGE